MKTFNFFFGLCLGQRHYSFTDNLSRTFKKEKTRAVSGQRLASLAAKTFENMRNDSDFALFYQKSCQQKKSMLHKKGFSCRQKQDDTGPKTISRLKKFNQKGNRQNFVHYSPGSRYIFIFSQWFFTDFSLAFFREKGVLFSWFQLKMHISPLNLHLDTEADISLSQGSFDQCMEHRSGKKLFEHNFFYVCVQHHLFLSTWNTFSCNT